jgi:hypothetical protein
VIVADFNGDAYPDVATTDLGSDEIKLLLNQGDGSFQVAAETSTGEAPHGLVAADLDADSHLDLVVAHAPASKPGKLSVLINEGDATFREPVEYDTVDNWFVTAADLDRDTDLDLVIEDGTGKGLGDGVFGARVLLNNGDGTFQEGERYFDLPYVGNVAVSDLNNDASPDLVVRRYPEQMVRVYLGRGDGTFGEPMDYETDGETGPELRWIGVADLNGDTYPDVAAVNYSGVVSVLINQGDGTLSKEAELDVGGEPWIIDAVDVDRDSSLDLLVGPTGSGNLSLLTNDGAGGFELTKDYYYKGAWVTDWVISDLDGDGGRELVGIDSTSVHVLPFDGN